MNAGMRQDRLRSWRGMGVRAFVLVLDSVGIGSAPDAKRYGDVGANTFGHVLLACSAGKLVRGGRCGPLEIPHLLALGLGRAAHEADPKTVRRHSGRLTALYGHAAVKSRGKDTVSGHWEMMGLPLDADWGHFADTCPCFPAGLTDALIARARLPGILGDCHAAGPDIVARYGEEHIETGMPICYTSSDSVFQIAAHEDHFGLDRLYMVCRIARQLVTAYNVCRVIARPFVGERKGQFVRTAHRRDYATAPFRSTLLDRAKTRGATVIAIGKVADVFAGSGITRAVPAADNARVFDALIECVRTAPDGALVVANFAEFDRLYGHRRDPGGYAGALESFDARLPEMMAGMRSGDLAVLTADHGCDPTFAGCGHTREYVPVLAFGPDVVPGSIGRRTSLADVGQTVARHLGLPPMAVGTAFYPEQALN